MASMMKSKSSTEGWIQFAHFKHYMPGDCWICWFHPAPHLRRSSTVKPNPRPQAAPRQRFGSASIGVNHLICRTKNIVQVLMQVSPLSKFCTQTCWNIEVSLKVYDHVPVHREVFFSNTWTDLKYIGSGGEGLRFDLKASWEEGRALVLWDERSTVEFFIKMLNELESTSRWWSTVAREARPLPLTHRWPTGYVTILSKHGIVLVCSNTKWSLTLTKYGIVLTLSPRCCSHWQLVHSQWWFSYRYGRRTKCGIVLTLHHFVSVSHLDG
jgi:hypothetical protein